MSTQEACQSCSKRAAVVRGSGVVAQVCSLVRPLQHPNADIWHQSCKGARWPYQPGLCCCVHHGTCLAVDTETPEL